LNGSVGPAPGGAERVYFNVPFAEKDKAKAIGMRFDGERRQWFAPSKDVAAAATTVFPSQQPK
jgi:hypothetical protein